MVFILIIRVDIVILCISSDGVNWAVASYLRPHSVFRPLLVSTFEKQKNHNFIQKILICPQRKLLLKTLKECLCTLSRQLLYLINSDIINLVI